MLANVGGFDHRCPLPPTPVGVFSASALDSPPRRLEPTSNGSGRETEPGKCPVSYPQPSGHVLAGSLKISSALARISGSLSSGAGMKDLLNALLL